MHPVLIELVLEETDALRRQIHITEGVRMLERDDTLACELVGGDTGDSDGRNQHHGENREHECGQQALHAMTPESKG